MKKSQFSLIFNFSIFLSFLFFQITTQQSWIGDGNYERADLIDSNTIYNISTCNTLMPSSFSISSYTDNAGNINMTISILPNKQTTVLETYSIDPYFDSIQLTNGKTVTISVYMIYDGNSFLVYTFFDTSSFRSTNPSSSNYVEQAICEVVYGQTSTKKRSLHSLNNENVNRVKKEKNHSFSTRSSSSSSSACQFLSQQPLSFVTYDEAINCLQSVPFNSTYRDQIIVNTRNALEFYVYRDINNNVTVDGDHISLNIMSELNRISLQNYSSDLDFQADMIDTFRKMKDGHTTWVYPECYSNWIFFQPFLFVSDIIAVNQTYYHNHNISVNNNNNQVNEFQIITISGVQAESFYASNYGINVSDYIGYTVLEINHENALNAIIQFSDNKIGYKDQATRFNAGISTFSDRYIDSDFPSQSSVNYTLMNPVNGTIVNITFDYFVLTPDFQFGVNNQFSQFSDWCFSISESEACSTASAAFTTGHVSESDTTSSKMIKKKPIIFNHPVLGKLEFNAKVETTIAINKMKNAIEKLSSSSIYSSSSQSIYARSTSVNTNVTSMNFGGFSLQRINESDVGVFIVPSFISNYGYFYQYQLFNVLYLSSIHLFHFNELIIDVSFNGGGYAYLGYYLSALFIPSITNANTLSNYDVIHNSLMDQSIDIINGNATLMNIIYNDQTDFFFRTIHGQNAPQMNDKWYYPGTSMTRGGLTSTYSSLIELSEPENEILIYFLNEIHNSVEYIAHYEMKNLMILTNGLCFSSCSIFLHTMNKQSQIFSSNYLYSYSNHFQYNGNEDKVHIVGYGGILGEGMAASNSPANVYSILDLDNAFSYLVNVTNLPQSTINQIPTLYPFTLSAQCFGEYFQFTIAEDYNNHQSQDHTLPLEFVANPVSCRLNFWYAYDIQLYNLAYEAFTSCNSSLNIYDASYPSYVNYYDNYYVYNYSYYFNHHYFPPSSSSSLMYSSSSILLLFITTLFCLLSSLQLKN